MDETEFLSKFKEESQCIKYLIQHRWPKGYKCPKCKSRKASYSNARHHYQCKRCKFQQSVTAGTVFEKVHSPLNEWFWQIYLLSHRKKLYTISARYIYRDRIAKLRMNKQWESRVMFKIRRYLKQGDSLCGLVELFDIDVSKVLNKRLPRPKKPLSSEHKSHTKALEKRYEDLKDSYDDDDRLLYQYQKRIWYHPETNKPIDLDRYSEKKQAQILDRLIAEYGELKYKTKMVRATLSDPAVKQATIREWKKAEREAQSYYDWREKFPPKKGRRPKSLILEKLYLSSKEAAYLKILAAFLDRNYRWVSSNVITLQLRKFEHLGRKIPFRTLKSLLQRLQDEYVLKLEIGSNIPIPVGFKKSPTRLYINPPLFSQLLREISRHLYPSR